ncbi:MAG: diaminopimelate epimerase [Clostridia bacterium]|nr:diaminopimelate epimerase [Clostridia bacterium]MBQ3519934.1 diaminopimelate epimerase [Clostridia bacterium]MBQ7837283.1 diaminopimelate epimerase [Clostridia bacterium]
MRFTKMHGLGNDYLYHYGEIEKPADVSIKLSERHFGIGSDGIILITPSDCADFKMRIFNADGSEAKMCGNGIRCVGKYVFDKGYTDKTHLTVETLSGIKTLDLKTVGGKAVYATVDMGKCKVNKAVTLEALNREVTLLPVSMGNPHAVIFVKDAENAPLTTLGAALEHHEFFPDGVNVEFVQVIDSLTLRMRVWERGSGITMACGTGSCASVAAAVAMGYCRENELVTVKLDGGDLSVKMLPDKTVMMTGPAKTVCECEVDM